MRPRRTVEAFDHTTKRNIGIVSHFDRTNRTISHKLTECLNAVEQPTGIRSSHRHAVSIHAEIVAFGMGGNFPLHAPYGTITLHTSHDFETGTRSGLGKHSGQTFS